MRVAIPREIAPGENRVALVPETVPRLLQAGLEVAVEKAAGLAAAYRDEEYVAAGAAIVPDAATLYASADVVLKVQKPRRNESVGRDEVELIKAGAVLVSFLQPLQDPELVRRIAERPLTAFSMDLIPRISRAQKMDALSSMSTVAGYKAALIAAGALPRFFPMLMTAAGTLPPARVLVLGGGVAGLQAIATARRLGAVVEAFDVRPAVREEVQSLGATFVNLESAESAEGEGGYAREVAADFLERERAALRDHVRQADAVIGTAMVPGKPAPVLVTREMVESMKPGSVIVDLAAEMGGNCELTQPGAEVLHREVRIIGCVNLASTMAYHASRMYSRNISSFLLHLIRDKQLFLDWADEITLRSCIAREGVPASQVPVVAAPAASV